ncbi:hypothetical protein L917_17201, partial [Phytophthora nicotianae]
EKLRVELEAPLKLIYAEHLGYFDLTVKAELAVQLMGNVGRETAGIAILESNLRQAAGWPSCL